ncbi:MAG: IMP cyclohydrolase [Myxococcota bacterium]
MSSIRKAYKTTIKENLPDDLTIDLGGQKLHFKKRTWTIADSTGESQTKGLRYGDNPGQPAALYRLDSGSFKYKDLEFKAGKPMVSGLTEDNFLQFGKHPGKTNLTDVNAGLNILINLHKNPAVAILKHNNPCGVATANDLASAYRRAYRADRIAAMGGVVVLNRAVDTDTATAISQSYSEVIAAPAYEEKAVEILKKRKNLRIIELPQLGNLEEYLALPQFNFTTLKDGGLILELNHADSILTPEKLVLANHKRKGKEYKIKIKPNQKQYEDLLFAWNIVAKVTSNSVVFVSDGVSRAIGTGEQDRVGAVRLAIKKAYTKYADNLAFDKFKLSIFQLEEKVNNGKIDRQELDRIHQITRKNKGGLQASVLASDGFFPFRDGVDTAIEQGISAIIQPGGSIRDHQSIEACNEAGISMVFTNKRVFKH